jgi:hypothetical protein
VLPCSFALRWVQIRYVMPKSALIKATPASEIQTYTVYNPGVAYAVERVQSAPTLPYGTSFNSRIRDVLVALSPTTTR